MTSNLHVLVVAYGGAEDLRMSLGALKGCAPVTVVDNSSSAACRAAVVASGASYIDPGRNLGFAGGVNKGLESIARPWPNVLLLNPDAVIDPDSLRALSDRLRAAPRTAAVAPSLVGLDGRPQRVSWPFPSPSRMWLEAIGLSCLVPSTGFLVGAILLLHGDALREVGPFDDRFFLYAEETDWQRRATSAGWNVVYCPEVQGRHRGAGTSTNPTLREARFHAGAEIYIRKWHGAAGWQLYRAAAIAGAVVRSATSNPSRRRAASARALLYLRGPRRALAALEVRAPA
jgi:GT2 family glycosyltransferase